MIRPWLRFTKSSLRDAEDGAAIQSGGNRSGLLRSARNDERLGIIPAIPQSLSATVPASWSAHAAIRPLLRGPPGRSAEHTSELPSPMRISYAGLRFKKQNTSSLNTSY